MQSLTIDKFFKSNRNYRGADYALNAPKLKPNEFCILNTDNDIPNPPYGLYWVALYRRKNKYYYFDSLGNPPVVTLNNMITNPVQLQPPGSNKCGLWAISFCVWMSRGNKYNDFISTWSEDDFIALARSPRAFNR